jgi:hypothetical protein
MADITLELVSAFVRKHGDVEFVDSNGTTRRLPSGSPDAFDLALKADRFKYGNRWYTRSDFSDLVNQK